MAQKQYKFDFFSVEMRHSNANIEARNASQVLQSMLTILEQGGNVVREIGGVIYELRFLERTEFGFRGIIGKHRQADLPNAAEVGGDERELELADNENILEKSFFHFYDAHQLLILQRNIYCVGSNMLAKFLSSDGFVTTLNPVIQPADVRLLAAGRIQLRKADIRIARPTNPDLFRDLEHDFNNGILRSMNGTNAASVRMEVRGDGRTEDVARRYLEPGMKRALRELVATFDVEKCDVLAEDEDTRELHPIDLVADRIVHLANVERVGRYPDSLGMWGALADAYFDNQGRLEEYFQNDQGEVLV